VFKRFYFSTEFKAKLEIGSNFAVEFNTKFINIAELDCLNDFVKSSAILIKLVLNSAAELLPISSFFLNSGELLY